MHKLTAILSILLVSAPLLIQAQERGKPHAASEVTAYLLPVSGKITDGQNKLVGCEVNLYRENEVVQKVITDKSGKFELSLNLNERYTIEFKRPGSMGKRVVVDTRHKMKVEELEYRPIVMDISLIPEERYAGADTDVLDMPFAIVRYDKISRAFTQDEEYTRSMMRTHGSLLLMAVRSDR